MRTRTWEGSRTRRGDGTCLNDFLYSLHVVSTVNLVEKMLHSFAPNPFLPPARPRARIGGDEAQPEADE